MRPDELAKLSATIEYGRAKYKLSRVTNPDLRARYEEIVSNYEAQHPELAVKTEEKKVQINPLTLQKDEYDR